MWEDFLVRGVMARKASIVDVDGKLQRQKEKIVMLIRIGEIRDWICRHLALLDISISQLCIDAVIETQ